MLILVMVKVCADYVLVFKVAKEVIWVMSVMYVVMVNLLYIKFIK